MDAGIGDRTGMAARNYLYMRADRHSWLNGLPLPDSRLLWIGWEKLRAIKRIEWRELADRLELPHTAESVDLMLCDFLVEFNWPAAAGRPGFELLVGGAADIDLDAGRQRLVAGQHRTLTDAGHTVLPVMIAVEGTTPTVVDVPNLVDVRVPRDRIGDKHLAADPPTIGPVLQRLVATARGRAR